jgi:hypothetical protein
MADNNTRKCLEVFSNIIKNTNNKKWECLHPGCIQHAISSHLLQKNGILNNIVENHHLLQIKLNDLFKIEKDGYMEFKRVGINQVVTFPLFCNHHDTQIFKSVEGDVIDFFNYTSQLLFSYRALCAELKKKQKNIEIENRAIDSNILSTLLGRSFIKSQEDSRKANQIGVNDLSFFKNEFESELIAPKNNFIFHTLKFSLLGLSISAVFSHVSNNANIIRTYTSAEPLNTVFVNVIPQADGLYVIIGYHKTKVDDWIIKYVESWLNCPKDEPHLLLSDLVTRVETWALAESLFKSISTSDIEIYKGYFLSSIQTGLNEENMFTRNIFQNN